MPRTKQIACLIIVCLSASITSFADVAPEAGKKRISLKLIVETQEDLSNYRFFIISGEYVEEYPISPSAKVAIEPLGGGARYSAGKFVAVPGASLKGLNPSVPFAESRSEMHNAIYEGKVPGIIELVKHSFAREVPAAEAGGWQDPVYRIEPDSQTGLKAVHVSGGANVSKTDSSESSGLRFWKSAAAAIVAGIFLFFGVAMLGILYFRRSSKQS